MLEIAEVQEKFSSLSNEIVRKEGNSVVFLGDQRARWDLEIDGDHKTVILREDKAKLWVIRHSKRTYQEFGVPTRLEDYLDPVADAPFLNMKDMLTAAPTIKETTDRKEIAEQPAVRWTVSVVYPSWRLRTELDIWLTAAKEESSRIYGDLMCSFKALDVFERLWYEKMCRLPGLPLLVEKRNYRGGSSWKDRTTSTLVKRTTRMVSAETFEIPDGYDREEFSLRFVVAQ